MNDNLSSDKGTWIRELIDVFVESPENTLGSSDGDRAFDRPIVGFASGGDPVFNYLKKDIGSFYLTPKEAFEKAYPDSGVKSEDLTVISWVLPHIKKTKTDNRKEDTYPSERWTRGKIFGLLFIIKLQNHLIKKLEEAGYRAMSPCAPPHWSEKISGKYSYASTWSERHAAFAAGLGTFGLCDGLITSVGKAMRCGSIVAEISITPTERPYKNHTEYCLFLTDGTCAACISRCPVGAITDKGHDKEKCKTHVDRICKEYIKEHYSLDEHVCGLCQTGVPCESGIPERKAGKF